MKIRVRVDEENGCEWCWDRLRAREPNNPLSGADDMMEGKILRETWERLKRCPHGASEIAPSIFIRL